jgi:hypothetical protein
MAGDFCVNFRAFCYGDASTEAAYRKRKHGELVIELGASEFFCEFCASSRPFKFIAAKKHKKARKKAWGMDA